MGKGCKDKARLITKDYPEPKNQKNVGGSVRPSWGQQRTRESGQGVPPGVPECDVILKDSTRFWYLEPALILLGVGGFLISGFLLIRSFLNDSISN